MNDVQQTGDHHHYSAVRHESQAARHGLQLSSVLQSSCQVFMYSCQVYMYIVHCTAVKYIYYIYKAVWAQLPINIAVTAVMFRLSVAVYKYSSDRCYV